MLEQESGWARRTSSGWGLSVVFTPSFFPGNVRVWGYHVLSVAESLGFDSASVTTQT